MRDKNICTNKACNTLFKRDVGAKKITAVKSWIMRII